jgi:hypothetical protein
VNERQAELDRVVSLQGLLGYLNFSEGRPDPRFQKQLNDAYGFLGDRGEAEPWRALQDALRAKLTGLKAGGTGAFRDPVQAEAVVALAFEHVLPAYRRHHADLLFHLSDRDLFQPFFLARVCEAVLAHGGPWTEEARIVAGALKQLHDFVGHRPVAILETRPRGEPYDHERTRPVPLFLRSAGVGWGRYQDLIARTLDLLAAAEPGLLAEAYFDPQLLDELAMDVRAYDHGHPVNKRPNYVFGEWDPHHIDNKGHFRRFVVRQLILDALLARVEQSGALPRAEALFEAAAVLAGTILMGAGTSGSGPTTHDSTTTLASLMPRIARYRDAFYVGLLGKVGGAHGTRLRQEAAALRQPFGGARQHLNQFLARHRAAQMQERHLAVLFAEMGYPEASRQEAAKIPTASVRLLSEVLSRLTTGQLLADRGEVAAAARLLPEVEDLLRRGIACGAFADPWNVLGFQGLFPLFQSREDSARDTRIDELVYLVEHIFNLYARLLSEAAAAGEQGLIDSLTPAVQRLARWWDRFATIEVGDVRRVHGEEAAASARHVAGALARWHERGAATADLAFWRQHLEGFRSPKAFALVVDALLRKQDYRAALALLMNWLGQAEQVPLEDGDYSFHTLSLRWMLGLLGRQKAEGSRQKEAESLLPPAFCPLPSEEAAGLVRKFFDHLEANADEFWRVPVLEVGSAEADEDAEEDVYGAAYEGVTFRDSADDNEEGAVADGGGPREEFDLEHEGERLGKRLRFLSTVGRLWIIAVRREPPAEGGAAWAEALESWLATARANQRRLLALLDAIHAYPVPEAPASYESLVEFDRRRVLKEQLTYAALGTCLDTTLAVGALQGALGRTAEKGSEKGSDPLPRESDPFSDPFSAVRPPWEPLALQLEQALLHGDADAARQLLPAFVRVFREEPLLFTALADGGDPRLILRVRLAQNVLRALASNLPRLGLLRETALLLQTARAMERARPAEGGRGMSEFDRLFEAAYQAVADAVVTSAADWKTEGAGDTELVELLEKVTEPFLAIWIDHSRLVRLSSLESFHEDADWDALRHFVQTYGGDLFHAKFMTLGNLRGILHRGVGAYLDYLRDNPDPLHPVHLLDDLGRAISRADAERHLRGVLQALVENYEEYKDYNMTTTQSDYGENLYRLLDFLRLKARYDRQAWEFRPLLLAHEALAHKGRAGAAVLWQESFRELVDEVAEEHLEELAELERAHGLRLRTVADRLEERFVKPLALDRLCALIEPAMEEARTAGGGPAFARLQEELRAWTATPTGVGLDLPQWLRQLETEAQRVRGRRSAIAALVENYFRVPQRALGYAELRQHLDDWHRSLGES